MRNVSLCYEKITSLMSMREALLGIFEKIGINMIMCVM
jgi:hypothetical protein